MIYLALQKNFLDSPIHLIENFENAKNDPINTWVLHHRLELTMDDDFAHSAEELKRLGMYFNRPAFELIFSYKERTHEKASTRKKSKFSRKCPFEEIIKNARKQECLRNCPK